MKPPRISIVSVMAFTALVAIDLVVLRNRASSSGSLLGLGDPAFDVALLPSANILAVLAYRRSTGMGPRGIASFGTGFATGGLAALVAFLGSRWIYPAPLDWLSEVVLYVAPFNVPSGRWDGVTFMALEASILSAPLLLLGLSGGLAGWCAGRVANWHGSGAAAGGPDCSQPGPPTAPEPPRRFLVE